MKPSVFLTAFAVKTLTKGKEVITSVNKSVVETAVQWIYSKQTEKGCFNAHTTDMNTFSPFFKINGSALKENIAPLLTSYVLSNLLESETVLPESVLAKAKQCVTVHLYNTTNQYTRAVIISFLSHLDSSSEVLQTLDDLIRQFPINSERKRNNI